MKNFKIKISTFFLNYVGVAGFSQIVYIRGFWTTPKRVSSKFSQRTTPTKWVRYAYRLEDGVQTKRVVERWLCACLRLYQAALAFCVLLDRLKSRMIWAIYTNLPATECLLRECDSCGTLQVSMECGRAAEYMG